MKNEEEVYDIAVVGAGPAGSNFARLVDSKRYRTVIVDGCDEKHTKPCGGLLSPDAQDVMARYDMTLPTEVLVSPQIFSVRTIDLETGVQKHYRRNYLNLDRYKFDKFLLSKVPDSVDRLYGRCVEIKPSEDCYKLRILVDSEEKSIYAKHLVGGDGASSVVRKALAKKPRLYRYTAIQQWFLADNANPFYSCVFDNSTSESCSWVFFKNEYIVFGGAFSPHKSRKAFEEQKRKLIEMRLLPNAEPQKTEACCVLRPRLNYSFCPGNKSVHLLGEAAGYISPSSLEGISSALVSGEKLALAFNRCRDTDKVQKMYEKDTARLRLKLKLKCIKRPFMYNKLLRNIILKTGLSSIDITVSGSER